MPLIAAITGSQVLAAVVWIIVAALIYFVVMWGIDKIGIPEPFHKIAVAIVVLLVVVLLVERASDNGGPPDDYVVITQATCFHEIPLMALLADDLLTENISPSSW